ncbi:MAG: hypothetical protein MRY63_04155 [Neomegalonema sp.]|nr:hypothetical protein [Neomegalonema sp.]
MAVFILSGANGTHPEAWPALLGSFSDAPSEEAAVINLSTPAGGAISALAQLGLARESKKGDVVVWDLAPSLNACLEECDYEPEEALRAVELFLRACARRKVPVVPLITDRLADAQMEEPGEISARLWHLFDRYAITPVSTTTVLRRSGNIGKLTAQHYAPGGDDFLAAEPVNRLLARGLAEEIDRRRTLEHVPIMPAGSIYEVTGGFLRLAVAPHATLLRNARIARFAAGAFEADVIEIAPGGAISFDVLGELIGLAPILSHDGGLMRISLANGQYKRLADLPFSTLLAKSTPESFSAGLGQISFAHHLGQRLTIGKPSSVVIENVSHLVSEGAVRCDLAAMRPDTPRPKAMLRILASIERRAPAQAQLPEPKAAQKIAS